MDQDHNAIGNFIGGGIAIIVVAVNFLVDLAYAALDPRIKYAE